MKKTGFITAVLTVCLLFSLCAPAALALDAPRLKSSDAYLVVDMKTGTELIELNPDMQHSIASLTKIMTCLLAVEAVENGTVSLDDMVTAQDDCLQGLDVSSSNAGITPGETMSFRDLLYCALVHSANDACNVIAVHISGSIGEFVRKMNARAAELGCENTQFVDTDGMLNRSEGHYSSPRDLYKITSEALKHPLFAQVCGTSDYTVSATNKREAFEVHNSNALMSTKGIYGDQYIYSGVSGVKTGFTKPAGYCLVSVCTRNNESVMCIVLGCNGPLTYTFAGEYQNFQDSVTLYDWTFANFESRTVFLAGEPLKRVGVRFAKDNGTVALCPDESLNLFLSKEITDKDIVVDIHPDEEKLIAPISEGQELGYADVIIAGEKKTTVRMIADASVEMEKSELVKAKLKEFFSSAGFKIAVALIISAVILFFIFRSYKKVIRRKKLQSRIQERDRAKWTEQNAVYAAREDARRRADPETIRRQKQYSQRQTPVQQQVRRRSYEEYEAVNNGRPVPAQNLQQRQSATNQPPMQRRIPIERVEVQRAAPERRQVSPGPAARKPQNPRTEEMPRKKPVVYESRPERERIPDEAYDLDEIMNSFK